MPPAVTLADAEREHILGALRETGWVVGGPKGAAARLGMKRSTLYKKMKKLGIFRVEQRPLLFDRKMGERKDGGKERWGKGKMGERKMADRRGRGIWEH